MGGGDSAIEAALGLAMQRGNQVTLSYRKGEFTRIKERNVQRLREALRAKRLEVIFHSVPLEFRAGKVVLQVGEETRELANDYVWIFAGGVAPNEFLKRIGIAFGPRDLTADTVRTHLDRGRRSAVKARRTIDDPSVVRRIAVYSKLKIRKSIVAIAVTLHTRSATQEVV